MSALKPHLAPEQKQQRSTDLMIFVFDLLVIYSVYSLLAIEHFSTDGYNVGLLNRYRNPIVSGRAVWLGLLFILKQLNIDAVASQEFFIILLIVILAWSAFRVLKQLKPVCTLQEGMLLSLPILLGVVNVHMQEWFFYSESALYYAVGILACVEAAVQFHKRHYFASMLLLSVGVLSYQITLGIYLIYALFFLFASPRQKGIKEYAKCIFIGLFGVVVIVIAQKILLAAAGLQSDRTLDLSFGVLFEKLLKILYTLCHVFYDAQDILPRGILPAVVCFSLFLIIRSIIINCKESKTSVAGKLMTLAFILVASIGVIIGPMLISSDTVWLAPRVLIGIFTLISMLAACAVLMERNNRLHMLMLALSAILLVVNIHAIQVISVDTFRANTIDEIMVHQVEAYIDQYEEDTDTEVSGIAYYYDEYVENNYSEIKNSWYDTNIRQHLISWAANGIINYRTGNGYANVPADPDVYEMYFAGQNWDTFMPDQQLVILDDVLHWCIY